MGIIYAAKITSLNPCNKEEDAPTALFILSIAKNGLAAIKKVLFFTSLSPFADGL